MPAHKTAGCVIWITGLSGAGKTTLARALMPHLPPRSLLLDGDELREVLEATTSSFDYTGRKALAFTYARLAHMLARQGLTVVVATISLFHEIHIWNRKYLPGYVEVFLDVPKNVRCTRDPKGLYAAEASGQQRLAGGEIAVEFPASPDIVFFGKEKVSECVEKLINFLYKNQLL